MEKIKNVTTGGLYWIDFKEFRLPEWGNAPNGKPHLAVLYKVNHFNRQEMFLALPITSNDAYHRNYGKHVIHRLYGINHEEKRHYVLLNQARVISKGRILKQFTIDEEKVVLSYKSLKNLKKAYLSYLDYYLSKPLIKKEGN